VHFRRPGTAGHARTVHVGLQCRARTPSEDGLRLLASWAATTKESQGDRENAAAPGCFMEHIAMLENGDDPATTNWGEHITGDEYNGTQP
jgi:hypothetical protein